MSVAILEEQEVQQSIASVESLNRFEPQRLGIRQRQAVIEVIYPEAARGGRPDDILPLQTDALCRVSEAVRNCTVICGTSSYDTFLVFVESGQAADAQEQISGLGYETSIRRS